MVGAQSEERAGVSRGVFGAGLLLRVRDSRRVRPPARALRASHPARRGRDRDARREGEPRFPRGRFGESRFVFFAPRRTNVGVGSSSANHVRARRRVDRFVRRRALRRHRVQPAGAPRTEAGVYRADVDVRWVRREAATRGRGVVRGAEVRAGGGDLRRDRGFSGARRLRSRERQVCGVVGAQARRRGGRRRGEDGSEEGEEGEEGEERQEGEEGEERREGE
mmetsp:Transcript_12857/g.50310  ORF Transcript_12857/g.50310 Transcript_12857/m.50310 type:complete len:222 (+) Transcript_12857:378-1043(+)